MIKPVDGILRELGNINDKWLQGIRGLRLYKRKNEEKPVVLSVVLWVVCSGAVNGTAGFEEDLDNFEQKTPLQGQCAVHEMLLAAQLLPKTERRPVETWHLAACRVTASARYVK